MSAADRAAASMSLARPRWARLLSRGELTRSAGVIALGHAAAYGVMLAATPLLTRLFSPAAFGVFATYSALMSMAGVSICLRYEAAIPLPRRDRAARNLAALAVGLAVVLAIAWGAALAGAAMFGRAHRQIAELAPYIAALAANLFAYGCLQTLTFWATRQRDFARLAQLRVVLVAATVAAQLAAAMWLPGVNGLVIGQLAGNAVAVGVVAWLLRDALFGPVEARSLAAAAWAYRRFPKYGVLAETLHISQVTAPPLVLMAAFGEASAGWFAVAWRIVGAPITLLVVPIARVYFAEAARIGASSPAELRAFFLRTLAKSAIVAVPVIGAIGLAGPTVFPIVLGDDWQMAGYYCRWLCPVLLCHLFAVAVRPTFDVTGRNDWQLAATAAGAALTCIGLLAPAVLGDGASASIVGLSIGGSVGYGISVGLAWRAIGAPRRRDSHSPQWRGSE
jgi:O-antigen/teichoic acid export membrane protein